MERVPRVSISLAEQRKKNLRLKDLRRFAMWPGVPRQVVKQIKHLWVLFVYSPHTSIMHSQSIDDDLTVGRRCFGCVGHKGNKVNYLCAVYGPVTLSRR